MTSLIKTIKQVIQTEGSISEWDDSLLWAIDEMLWRYRKYLGIRNIVWHKTIYSYLDEEPVDQPCVRCGKVIHEEDAAYRIKNEAETALVCPACLLNWMLATYPALLGRKAVVFTDWHDTYQFPYHQGCFSRWQKSKGLVVKNGALYVPLAEMVLDMAELDFMGVATRLCDYSVLEECVGLIDPKNHVLKADSLENEGKCIVCGKTIPPRRDCVLQQCQDQPDACDPICSRCFVQHLVTHWMPHLRASNAYWSFADNSFLIFPKDYTFSGITPTEQKQKAL